MIPDPTPVSGIWNMPRPDTPWLVIVTTESRTEATTAGRSVVAGLPLEPVDVVTPAAAAGAGLDGVLWSGPATSAVVTPVASTADSTATPTTVPIRRPPEPEPELDADSRGLGATGTVDAAAGAS